MSSDNANPNPHFVRAFVKNVLWQIQNIMSVTNLSTVFKVGVRKYKVTERGFLDRHYFTRATVQ